MNDTPHTLGQSTTAANTSTTRDTPPLHSFKPAWKARSHDQGIDLDVFLPGVRKEAVRVEVVGNHLHLEARRTSTRESGRLVLGNAAPHLYRLNLQLAASLDSSKLRARLENGLLNIHLPTADSHQPQRIEIL